MSSSELQTFSVLLAENHVIGLEELQLAQQDSEWLRVGSCASPNMSRSGSRDGKSWTEVWKSSSLERHLEDLEVSFKEVARDARATKSIYS